LNIRGFRSPLQRFFVCLRKLLGRSDSHRQHEAALELKISIILLCSEQQCMTRLWRYFPQLSDSDSDITDIYCMRCRYSRNLHQGFCAFPRFTPRKQSFVATQYSLLIHIEEFCHLCLR
jgi:hypothetical protein